VKRKILEVLATLRRAGAETIAVSLAGGLDRRRFEVEVVSLFDAFPGGFEPDLDSLGAPHHHLGKRRGFDPRMFGRLRRVVAAFRPDVVHTHSYVLRYALMSDAPAIVHTVHNMADREVDRLGRLINRFAFRRGAKAVAISETVAASFRRCYGFEPAAVIPNGVDLSRFGGRSDWRRRNGFSEDDLLVVSVGRFEEQKNPLGLIEAFAEAARERPGWRLLLAGAGSLLDAARERASQLAVGDRTHFLGLRTDVPELLGACDLFAMASEWEGSPVAVIEAMASGLPIVATAVGGVPELVADGETGALVGRGEIGALAAAIRRMGDDGERRRQMAERARARSARFGIQAMIDAYAELFERVAGGRAR
jgi:glycosyltransferase involved in cell wall biosynthesis